MEEDEDPLLVMYSGLVVELKTNSFVGPRMRKVVCEKAQFFSEVP